MTLEQIIAWIIVGALVGFLADLVIPQVKLGLVEKTTAGILGALGGGWLLGVVGIVFGTGLVGTVLAGFPGAILALALLVGVRLRSDRLQMRRQRQIWSFIQPFEE